MLYRLVGSMRLQTPPSKRYQDRMKGHSRMQHAWRQQRSHTAALCLCTQERGRARRLPMLTK